MRGLFPAARRRNEKLAKKLLRAVDDRHVEWMDRIFNIVPILPAFSSVRNEKALTDAEIIQELGLELHGDHFHEVQKVHGDVPGINQTFAANFGSTVAANFDKATDAYLQDIVGTSPASLVGEQTIWGDTMNEGFQTWVDDTRTQTRTEWERQPKRWRDANPFDEFFDRTFWAGSEFIANIRTRGFQRITSKITIEFAARAKEIVNEGLASGRGHAQIARDLNNTIGTRMIAQGRPAAGLYHWQRLVRTEMADSIASTQKATYIQQGVPMLRYSASVGRCEICDFWATQNGGIYQIDNIPDIVGDTHPSCRCQTYPVFRLRSNQSSNVFKPENPFLKN